MTDLERSLLNIIQNDFPIEPRPFRTIGERLQISEEMCIDALKRLRKIGILRTIRAVISWNKLGISTILVGMKVDPLYLDSIAAEVSSIDEVTHNYAREGRLNLWFTLIYETQEKKAILLNRLRQMQGVSDIKEFCAEKTYKIGLILDV
jgi:DNA-binding Lrp family transcriptional regulator